jgi:hypothetical protein
MAEVVLGCRVHSGWAALVVIAGSPAEPKLIDRRRIELADPAIVGSKQPYHAAEPLPFAKAKTFIDRCTRSTEHLATNALRAVVDDLKEQGHESVACGVVLGSGKPLPELASVLRSHALIHTAEGEFFRNAVLHAGAACGLAVKGAKERELIERSAAEFGISTEDLQGCLAKIGRAAGPPWTQDQKLATLAGWLALRVFG